MGLAQRFLALAHNDQVEPARVDRPLSGAASALGLHTLVVDAADNASAPHEMALIDLPSCVETLSNDVSYLAARGLPIRHVDTQGRCAGFLDALQAAAPQADLVLVHAGTVDLTRLFAHQRMRPLLVGADTPRAMTEAYATLKRLAQRPGWLAHDLLIVADPHGPRTARLGECRNALNDEWPSSTRSPFSFLIVGHFRSASVSWRNIWFDASLICPCIASRCSSFSPSVCGR